MRKLTLRQKRMHLILDELEYPMEYTNRRLLEITREVLGFRDDVCISYIRSMKANGMLNPGNNPISNPTSVKSKEFVGGSSGSAGDERMQLDRIEGKLDLIMKKVGG